MFIVVPETFFSSVEHQENEKEKKKYSSISSKNSSENSSKSPPFFFGGIFRRSFGGNGKPVSISDPFLIKFSFITKKSLIVYFQCTHRAILRKIVNKKLNMVFRINKMVLSYLNHHDWYLEPIFNILDYLVLQIKIKNTGLSCQFTMKNVFFFSQYPFNFFCKTR